MCELDHLVVAVPDVEAAARSFQAATGVMPEPGGRHEGLGTRNVLVSLGQGAYLELVGPDEDQPRPAGGRWLGVDGASGPRLTTWAGRVPSLELASALLGRAGFPPGPVRSMTRARADGTRLAWRLTLPVEPPPAGGLVPFLIDWGETPHPSDTAPGGVTLVSLEGCHPDPGPVRRALGDLGSDLVVRRGSPVGLRMVVRGPGGKWAVGPGGTVDG